MIEEAIYQMMQWIETKNEKEMKEIFGIKINTKGISNNISNTMHKYRPLTSEIAYTLANEVFTPIGELIIEIITDTIMYKKINKVSINVNN